MQKSQFLTLVLSAIPGLGHVYVGLPIRGICIMGGFFAWAFVALLTAYGSGGVETLLMLAPLPIIWIFSLVDALSQCSRVNRGVAVPDALPIDTLREGPEPGKPEGFWILLFSLVPGAGHMYLGWQKKGLTLMTMFFGAVYLTYWLRLSVFLLTLPMIWFYSFFDVLQLASAKPAVPEDARAYVLGLQPRWVGIGLIALGVVILFDRIVSPLLNLKYQTLEMIRTGVTALLFVGGGLRLVLGSRVRVSENIEEEDHP